MLQFKYKYVAHVFEYRFPIHQEQTAPWTAAQDPIPKSLKWFQPHHPPPFSSWHYHTGTHAKIPTLRQKRNASDVRNISRGPLGCWHKKILSIKGVFGGAFPM